MSAVSTLQLYPAAVEDSNLNADAREVLGRIAQFSRVDSPIPDSYGFIEFGVAPAVLSEALDEAVPEWRDAGWFYVRV